MGAPCWWLPHARARFDCAKTQARTYTQIKQLVNGLRRPELRKRIAAAKNFVPHDGEGWLLASKLVVIRSER